MRAYFYECKHNLTLPAVDTITSVWYFHGNNVVCAKLGRFVYTVGCGRHTRDNLNQDVSR